MPALSTFGLFLTSALILAVSPGPAIFYVLARTIKGGRREGIVSALGTAIGGLGHVVAAALGLAAVIAASATAFTIIKFAGAIYLIYLGIGILTNGGQPTMPLAAGQEGDRHAFYQGIITEILNPKTALFFLAFIPQFINPQGNVFLQFILLGIISVIMNTSVDFVVAFLADSINIWLQENSKIRRGQQMFSGLALIALGVYIAVVGKQ